MSFLSDLFEGNFGNLGTDITDAPSSFVTDWSSEAPYVEGAAALGGGLLLGPAIGGALAGLDGAAAAAPASLDAANATFGAFDPASLAGDTAAAGLDGAAGTTASLATDAGTLPSSDVAAAVPGVDGAPTVIPGGDGALPQDTMAFASSGSDGSLNSFLANPTGAADGGTPLAYGGDGAAPVQAGADGAQAGLNAANAQFGSFNPQNFAAQEANVASPGGQLGADIPGGGTVGESGVGAPTAAGPSLGGAAKAPGGALGSINSALSSPITRTALGLAPLAVALGMGEAQLPSSAQQAQANAAVLSQFGQANINGTLNAGQMAQIQVLQQNLTNQVRQQLYNMGVQDPSKDSRYTQMMAYVDTQVTAATATMIQQNITNALNALGAAGTELNQIAQMQMTADQNFTNTLVNATKSLGLLAGTNFAGGTSYTLTPTPAVAT
jgi:hypothetical protein